MDKKTAEQTDIEWIKGALKRIEEVHFPRVDKRIHSLEIFKWKSLGGLAVIVAIIETLFHGK